MEEKEINEKTDVDEYFEIEDKDDIEYYKLMFRTYKACRKTDPDLKKAFPRKEKELELFEKKYEVEQL
jgi:hypothetical protein